MPYKTLQAILDESVREVPDKTAFIFKDQPLSFKDFNDKVNRCACGLAKLGIRKGDTFGIVLRNCPEFVVLFFGLIKLGAVAVPVNFLEKGEKLGYIFKDAEVKGCLTSKEFLKNVTEAQKIAPTLKHIFINNNSEGPEPLFDRLLEETTPQDLPPTEPEDLVLLIYTAGTTGVPKGVMLTHKNFAANLESCRGAIDLHREDVFLCLLPMFHSFAWTTNVLLPLRLGSTTVVIESLLPFDPVIKAIWKYKVTLFCGVPPIFATLVQKIKGLKALMIRWVNPVRVAISGAAALPEAVQRGFEKTFGIPLLEGYGLTEAAPVVSLNPLHGQRKPGTVGLPIPGVHVKLVDENEQKVDPHDVGEIFVKGDNVMAGYYNKPRETRETLTDDHWLKTGDMGQLDADGYLKIVDRKKDLIIVKGLNVYPQEIEEVIISCGLVAETAVVGLRDNTGDEVIKAFVVLRERHVMEKSELLKLCREKLAPYKVPKDIEFMHELPKNTLGKILKKELRKS